MNWPISHQFHISNNVICKQFATLTYWKRASEEQRLPTPLFRLLQLLSNPNEFPSNVAKSLSRFFPQGIQVNMLNKELESMEVHHLLQNLKAQW
jgi:hypothetical protein